MEVAQPVPSPWTTATPGFYYVDRTQPSATDTNNPYGTPALPRRTIPVNLPAGSVVELHGTYSQRHTSPNGITASGTAANPVFIRGASAGSKPVITDSWEVGGTYYILEHLEFAFTGQYGIYFLAPTSFGAIRHSDVHGNLDGGGLALNSWTGATLNNFVLYNNLIHDNGDVNSTFDQDVHGVAIGARVNNVWVVDNQVYRNSGDGLQINAGSLADQPTTHHIYVGRNISHSNKQTGFWTKQAVDVIFSQNLSHSHRPGNSSNGAGMGYQYAPERVWYLFNHIHDCDFGIVSMSDSGLGSGQDTYFIGNLIHNIHSSQGFNPNTGWSNAGIMLAGGVNRYLVNNTIHDADSGIRTPGQTGKLEMANNILTTPTKAGSHHIFVEFPAITAASTMHHNLLSGQVRIMWGDGVVRDLTGFQLATGKGQACVNADPLLFAPATENFRLSIASPAIDTGSVESIYSAYLSRYGVDIARDIVSITRPQYAGWDMGAYEFVATTFADVPIDFWAYRFIQALYDALVTSGCSANPPLYCPENVVSRDQMAVFLLRSKEGSAYWPPPCSTATFGDVPCSNPYSAWIYELAARGVTAGCGNGNYCPASAVTREQMAVFLLRTLAYTPPACANPSFGDVPCSSPFAPWIYELVRRGVTAGCGSGNYCPAGAVSRAQMAVFLVKTFNIPLP